jgi:hypothetical protein
MRLFITLLAIVSLFFIACKKENGGTNGNGQTTDTTALGKFVKATGITDATLKVNLDSLITRARRHGWWDLCKVIYPFAGGTSTTCKFNLKDPRDSDSAFRVVFNGSTWTFDSQGIHPGASGYGYTYFNPAIQIADTNSCHLSVYSLDDIAGGTDNSDIGAWGGGLGFYLSTRDFYPDSSGKPFASVGTKLFQGTGVNGAGFFLTTKDSVDIADIYRGPVLMTSTFSEGKLPNLSLFLCNVNFPDGGEPYINGFSQRGLGFATIGAGIDSTMEALMYSDISDFMENK